MPVFADALPMPSDLPINSIDPYSLYGVGATGGLTTTQLIIYGVIGLFSIVCMWIIFKKADRKGRESIIPFWNSFVTYKIAGKKNRFWYLLIPGLLQRILLLIGILLGVTNTTLNVLMVLCGLASLVGLVLFIIMLFKLGKKFGKSAWFGLGLLLLSPIFLGILAFGKAKYQGE